MASEREPQPCPECSGAGTWTESEHGCNGTEADCLVRCPVPVQGWCRTCNGSGYVEAPDGE